MKNVIEFFFRQENEIGNVVFHESIILVAREMLDVREVPGHEIIDRDDLVTFAEQAVGQMRSEKASATGDN